LKISHIEYANLFSKFTMYGKNKMAKIL
jgi:hypothetical protein